MSTGFWIADAHCDTLQVLAETGAPLTTGSQQVDLGRLKAGGVGLQFFAAFADPAGQGGFLRYTLSLIAAFHRQVLTCPGVAAVLTAADLERARAGGELAALLAVEGGEALQGDAGLLEVFFRLGVRSLGLTWNGRNELGGGVGGEPGRRLTPLGRAVVRRLNDLCMIVDLAHLGEAGFWDALDLSRAPVMASHANCRALCDHPRNLTDAQLRALGRQGGWVGINCVADFVSTGAPAVGDVADHIIHAASLAGIEHVGLGADFDGTPHLVPGLEGPEQLPRLAAALAGRGLTRDEIGRVLGLNLEQYLRRVLPRC